MCSVQFALAGLQLGMQAQNAKAQKDFAKFREEQTEKIARANFANTLNSLEQRRSQERERASEALQRVTRRAIQAQGTAVASAASNGVTGTSVDALVGDFVAQQLNQQELIDRNLQFSEAQIGTQRVAARAKVISDVLSGVSTPVPLPDYLSPLLTIADETHRLRTT